MLEEILLATVELSQPLIVVIAIFIAMAFAAPILGWIVFNKFKLASLEQHYADSLQNLNLQMNDKLLTQEMYRWMLDDLERNYKKFFEKD